jgi:hypothetical protein
MAIDLVARAARIFWTARSLYVQCDSFIKLLNVTLIDDDLLDVDL